ncbi:cerebellin 18 [Anarrhichthys ocellatus]|uniref:cerebellin 18 n=1 Tax=Anarrhichthys ocellatus TaxID=433405 RepID=UPI0012EDE186|nr:complement C1q tumor necrosis factor-related protein 3-like [Anarrhichthys ocellatus]
MVVLPLVFLLGSQFLCGRGEFPSAGIEGLKQAALEWKGERKWPCVTWDCNCAFQHQRGCCCVADQMFKLEEDTYERIEYLWHDIISLKYKVKKLTDYRQIAFKATMALSAGTNLCFGPFNTNVPIPYANVSLNDANGYHPSLGVFTAPCAGVYVFSFTVYSNVWRNGLLYYKVQLMKNGVVAVSVWENNREDFEDTANQVLVLKLQRGDQVYTELMSGRKLCGHLQYNIFTGYILYPDAEENEY